MDGATKLKQDLEILKAMVEELANYLYSEAIYWPMFKAGYPQMTLGGYFMRQHRLERLSYLLVDADQVELKQFIIQFKEMTFDKKALLVEKGLRELEARANQWEQNLKEYWDSDVIEEEYYKTDAEVRTMIVDLIYELEIDLSKDDKKLLLKIDALDHELRANWQEGDFIWPEDWIPAYGKGEYWWLYGLPCITESN
jgi:nicotinamide mononucleotide adenylyltransferase